jgi:hypothetical protein
MQHRRPPLPNSGRCELTYLFTDLYADNSGGDRQLGRAVRIEVALKRRLTSV